MSRSAFRVLFYANGSKEKNGIVPLMGRVTINGIVAQFSSKQTDIKKEKLKNSAADVGAKLMDGVSSLLGTPTMNKIEQENKELKIAIQTLYDENKQIRRDVEAIKSKALEDEQQAKEVINANLKQNVPLPKLNPTHGNRQNFT